MNITEYKDKVIEDLKDLIKAEVTAGTDRTEANYMDKGLELLKRRYQNSRKWSRFQAWSLESREEVAFIWDTIQPDVLAAIEEYLRKFRHRKLTKEINAASAQAIIKAAMKEAGLKHQFTAQTYRAKVSVRITENRCLTFYVPYSKLMERFPQIMESIKRIHSDIQTLGNISINKIYRNDTWI